MAGINQQNYPGGAKGAADVQGVLIVADTQFGCLKLLVLELLNILCENEEHSKFHVPDLI
jgi:hypothetical protein